MLPRFGFTGSAAWRVGAVAAYALVASMLIVFVENYSRAPQSSAPSTPTVEATWRIDAEATFEVEKWTVTANGQALTGASDQSSWHGEWRGSDNAELFIEAVNSDYFAENNESVRIILTRDGRRIEKSWWGKGTATLLLSLGGSDEP